MSSSLINHIQKIISLTEEEIGLIMNRFNSVSLDKKEYVLELNSKSIEHYFIVKGCVRLFFIDQKGVEQTIQFAIENWWISDYHALYFNQNSEFAIQALEKTEILSISNQLFEDLLNEIPALNKYFRVIAQRAYTASLMKTKYIYDFSREEFYMHFSQNFPEFVQRIPQHIIASYLNMTPEYLSEIKKKIKS